VQELSEEKNLRWKIEDEVAKLRKQLESVSGQHQRDAAAIAEVSFFSLTRFSVGLAQKMWRAEMHLRECVMTMRYAGSD
jgi:hypothetical protein